MGSGQWYQSKRGLDKIENYGNNKNRVPIKDLFVLM